MLALIAHPYDPDLETNIQGPPYPFGDALDLDGSMTFSVIGGETVVYMADTAYTTAPSDTPANTHFPAVLLTPFSYEEKLFEGMEPEGRTQGGFGDIVIANGAARDGTAWLDDKLHLGWDGRDLLLYRGQPGAAFSTFELVAKLTCDGLEWNEDTVSLRLRNGQAAFEQPIDRPRYGGTGGTDGGSDLAGKGMPVALGHKPFNVSPVLVDAANLIYQFHHGTNTATYPLPGTFSVRDKGVGLSLEAGFDGGESYGSLISDPPAAGEFSYSMVSGLIGLGASPDGRVTCTPDVGTEPPVAITPATLGEIIEVLVTEYMGAGNFADTRLDTAAFAQLDADYPHPIGYYVGPDEEPSAGEILDRLMGGARGYWRVRLDGTFTLGLLAAPSGTADHTIDASEIEGPIRRLHCMPSWSRKIGYRRNWTVQSADEIASSVAADDRALYAALYTYAPVEDQALRNAHLLARDVTVESYLTGTDAATNAATEAARQQALFGTERDIYEIDVVGDPFGFELGELVDITGVTRFGWSDPKKLRIIGRSVDDPGDGFTARVTLRLWG